MTRHEQILKFIQGMRNEGTIKAFTEGYCYWFCSILIGYSDLNGWDDYTLLYHPERCHFALRIGERVYDITGAVDDIGYEVWVAFSIRNTDRAARIHKQVILKSE